MSKENLKKSKKNYWFSITLIALALFCVGAALLYSQKLLSEKLSTPKAPVASYTARYGARSISKVQFLNRKIALLTMDSAQARLMEYLLAHADAHGCVQAGNMSRLAKTLGIGRTSLYRQCCISCIS